MPKLLFVLKQRSFKLKKEFKVISDGVTLHGQPGKMTAKHEQEKSWGLKA